MRRNVPGLHEFLNLYENMALVPNSSDDLFVSGRFEFAAQFKSEKAIHDAFEIEIQLPSKFPLEVPIVRELGGRIPSDGNHHVNPNGSLCLGSYLRLRVLLEQQPDLLSFAKNCIVPFLYWISLGKFAQGELAHGNDGLVQDYLNLFGLKEPNQVIEALRLLSIKKRIANKRRCPCDCGRRLGRCEKRFELNKFRRTTPNKMVT
jgi:hypothetical protein